MTTAEPVGTDQQVRHEGDPRAGGATLRLWCALTALFFVIGAGWSFSTAPGGSPDEIQHVFRAWTVWDGQVLLPPAEGGGAMGDMPDALVSTAAGRISCFTYRPEVPADCAEPWPEEQGPPFHTTVLAGRYNPVYYGLVGWPLKLFPPLAATYWMRLVSALVAAGLLALAATCVSARVRAPFARVGAVVGLTPLAMFLAGTVNPSGLEITAAVCGWTGVLLLSMDPEHPAARWWATAAGLGLSLMVLSRPASYLWLAPVAVVALILINRQRWALLIRRPAVWVALAAVAVATVLALVWNKLARTSDLVGSTLGGTLADGLRRALRDSVDWWHQQIGVLGYLDTDPPLSVMAATAASVLVLLVLALAWTRGRRRLALLAAVAAALFVPVAAAAAVYPGAGPIWQGRYGMPITVGAVILAGLLLDDAMAGPAPRRWSLARWLGGFWALAGIAMVYYNLQRYEVGAGAGYLFLFQSTAWSGPLPGWLCLMVAVCGYLGVVALLLGRGEGRPRTDTRTVPDQDRPDDDAVRPTIRTRTAT